MDGNIMDYLNHWTWWVFGVLFVIVEILVPGFVFLWLGVSAGVMGFVYLLLPGLSAAAQITIFAVLSVVSVVVGRAYLRKHPTKTDDSGLNRRSAQYIDRVFTLDEPIVNGLGKLIVDDSMWKISGPDMPAGTQVRVTTVEGVILIVERADPQVAPKPVSPGPPSQPNEGPPP